MCARATAVPGCRIGVSARREGSCVVSDRARSSAESGGDQNLVAAGRYYSAARNKRSPTRVSERSSAPDCELDDGERAKCNLNSPRPRPTVARAGCRPSRSTNATSMANCMKNVWMLLHGARISAASSARLERAEKAAIARLCGRTPFRCAGPRRARGGRCEGSRSVLGVVEDRVQEASRFLGAPRESRSLAAVKRQPGGGGASADRSGRAELAVVDRALVRGQEVHEPFVIAFGHAEQLQQAAVVATCRRETRGSRAVSDRDA